MRGRDPGRALELFRESLGIARGLVEWRPGDLQDFWDLGVAVTRLAYTADLATRIGFEESDDE